MKTIVKQFAAYNKDAATSQDLYSIAQALVVKYQGITAIKAQKPAISEAFGHYKEILSRCKELLISAYNSNRDKVLGAFTYKNILSAAWDLAKQDPNFSELCRIAEEKGLFVTAEDFIRRFYPRINQAGVPLVVQSYTDGLYRWSEYHTRPVDKFTDTFALQAMKASIRFCYDSIRNERAEKKGRVNTLPTDTPLRVDWLDPATEAVLDADVAVRTILAAKEAGKVQTTREYNKEVGR